MVGAAAVTQLDTGDQLAVHAGDEASSSRDDSARPTSNSIQNASGLRFRVLAELEPGSAPSTKPYAATDQDELEWMWMALGQPAETTPKVDFDEHVVVAATVPGNGCRSQLTHVEFSDGELTAVLTGPDRDCSRPALLWTAVISIERDQLPASFDVVVPTEEVFGYDDARARVDLDGYNGPETAGASPENGYPRSMDEVEGEILTVEPSDGPPARVGLDAQFGLCAEAREVFLGCSVPGVNTPEDPYTMLTAAGPPEFGEPIDDAIDIVHAHMPPGTETVVLTFTNGTTDPRW